MYMYRRLEIRPRNNSSKDYSSEQHTHGITRYPTEKRNIIMATKYNDEGYDRREFSA